MLWVSWWRACPRLLFSKLKVQVVRDHWLVCRLDLNWRVSWCSFDCYLVRTHPNLSILATNRLLFLFFLFSWDNLWRCSSWNLWMNCCLMRCCWFRLSCKLSDFEYLSPFFQQLSLIWVCSALRITSSLRSLRRSVTLLCHNNHQL